ncbi:MAG: BlaI/MecI/CopY family transcriptional regulator [Pirellulales bacterium]|nr:BlaI/MecI/CopY family transcriptional regulator [Pirellulales bacterium]
MDVPRNLRRLSSRELDILAMLWQRGPLTLREAHEAFEEFGDPVGYTTIQTRLNRLVKKGVVRRTDRRPAAYEAAVAPSEVGAQDLDTLLDRVTQGRLVPLVAHFLTQHRLSPDEIQELKSLIDTAETKWKQSGHGPSSAGPGPSKTRSRGPSK